MTPHKAFIITEEKTTKGKKNEKNEKKFHRSKQIMQDQMSINEFPMRTLGQRFAS